MESKRILVVDDEKDYVHTIRYFLEMNGYSVLVAHDGNGALEQAKEMPDLILLDIMMPGMGGIEVLRKLRCDSDTCDIPVIMLSIKSDPKTVSEARSLKACDFVKKDADLDELLETIKRHIH
jgi:DNA-binding response OmpR family regulator